MPVTASASDGATITQTSTYTVKLAVPSLGAIHASHSTWREAGKLAKLAAAHRHKAEPKPSVGMTISFTLNTTATVTLTFTHTATGRVVKHKCVAATKHNRHDRSCKRTVY